MGRANGVGREIDFLFEMGNIRHIVRMWSRFLSPEFGNLAEHHFRMFWIAMILAEHEKNVDTGKLAKMVMVHDIAESRTGDADYLARQYVERNEALGLQDMLKDTLLEKEFFELWQEYEDQQSLEAKIAKDADNLDVDFELAEQKVRGNDIQSIWKETRLHVRNHKLHTKAAKEILSKIQTANPHDWHLKARNRYNSGDWSKLKKANKKDKK